MRAILLGAGGGTAERRAQMADFLALSDSARGALRNPTESEVGWGFQATKEGALRRGSAANGEAGLVEFFDVTATIGEFGRNAGGDYGTHARRTCV